jgi:hypothetical protein
MIATSDTPDILGLGPAAPKHRDGRDLRDAYSDEPETDALQADDVRESRLVHRLLRLGGEIPADRWQRIDAVLDRLLVSETLDPRDAIRIAQVQATRERVIATATGKVLDKLAADQLHISGPEGPIELHIEYDDDYFGTAAAAARRGAAKDAPQFAPLNGESPRLPDETATSSSPTTTTATESTANASID